MRILLLFVVIFIFHTCQTLDPLESYTFEKENLKLPYLIPEADLNNINLVMHYNETASTESSKYNKLSFFDANKNYDQELAFRKEPRINDMIKFYLLELERHMEIDTSNVIGSIQLHIIAFDEKRNAGLMMAHLLLLGAPSIFGVPFNIIDVGMEITLNITDTKGQIIAVYTGKGYGNEYMAMYWGYGGDAYRSATLKSFRNALDNAMSKLQLDQKSIFEKLK